MALLFILIALQLSFFIFLIFSLPSFWREYDRKPMFFQHMAILAALFAAIILPTSIGISFYFLFFGAYVGP